MAGGRRGERGTSIQTMVIFPKVMRAPKLHLALNTVKGHQPMRKAALSAALPSGSNIGKERSQRGRTN